ncbi:hypothetical protein N9W34_01755 [Rickettsiales bacterium]|nr:hypothetical protein [Rickettsiales bacterium]
MSKADDSDEGKSSGSGVEAASVRSRSYSAFGSFMHLVSPLATGSLVDPAAIPAAPLLNNLKIQQQVLGGGVPYKLIAQDLYKKGGIRELYRGAGALGFGSMLGATTAGSMQIFLEDYLKNAYNIPPLHLAMSLAFAGGLTETAMRAPIMAKYELPKTVNGNSIPHAMGNVSSAIAISKPLLLRNTIFWAGTSIAHEFSQESLGPVNEALLALCVGSALSVVSYPADRAITQVFLDPKLKPAYKHFLESVKQDGIKKMSAGLMPRIAMVGVYTALTSIFQSLSRNINKEGGAIDQFAESLGEINFDDISKYQEGLDPDSDQAKLFEEMLEVVMSSGNEIMKALDKEYEEDDYLVGYDSEEEESQEVDFIDRVEAVYEICEEYNKARKEVFEKDSDELGEAEGIEGVELQDCDEEKGGDVKYVSQYEAEKSKKSGRKL